MITLSPTNALAAIHHLPYVPIERDHRGGVTLIVREGDPIEPHTVHGMHIHVVDYDPSVAAVINWAKINNIRYFVYDNPQSWIAWTRDDAIDPRTVDRLLSHTDRWWHRHVDQLLRDWIQLLYGSSYAALSKSAQRMLRSINHPTAIETVVFDQLVHQHPPSVVDWRAMMVIDRFLLAHRIERYSVFAVIIQQRWRQLKQRSRPTIVRKRRIASVSI